MAKALREMRSRKGSVRFDECCAQVCDDRCRSGAVGNDLRMLWVRTVPVRIA
jgi:hypothetical protein